MIPRCRRVNRIQTAFCSYQESTKESGSSFTEHPNASASATATHIHQSWQTTDLSQIEIIETEFSTCQGENDTVRRCLLYKFRIIVSTWLGTITAGNQEEMADRA